MKIYMVSLFHRATIKKETTGRKYNVRICYAGRPFTLAAHFCGPTETYWAHSQCWIYAQTVRLNIVPSNFETSTFWKATFLIFPDIFLHYYLSLYTAIQDHFDKRLAKTDGSSRFDPPFWPTYYTNWSNILQETHRRESLGSGKWKRNEVRAGGPVPHLYRTGFPHL